MTKKGHESANPLSTPLVSHVVNSCAAPDPQPEGAAGAALHRPGQSCPQRQRRGHLRQC